MCQALGTRSQIRHSPYLQWLQSYVSIQSYHVVEGRMTGFWMNYCGNQGTSIMYLRSGTRRWYLSEGNIWVGGFLAVWKWRKRIRTWILLLRVSYFSPHKIPNPMLQFLLWRIYIFFRPVITELFLNILLRNISRHGWLCGIWFHSWILEPTALMKHQASDGGERQDILIGQTVPELPGCLQDATDFVLKNRRTCLCLSDNCK